MRSFLRERLPEPLVPSFFVVLADLPRTATGKVDRAALPAPLLAPPAPVVRDRDADHVPPAETRVRRHGDAALVEAEDDLLVDAVQLLTGEDAVSDVAEADDVERHRSQHL